MGLALFWPAYFGAEPWTGSKTAAFSPMFAPGATPRPPTSPAARSLTMSPYRFGRTSTSYSSGFWTSCMHMLSTMRSSNSTRPAYSAATCPAALEEEAVRELHDVRLVDGGDLAAAVLHRVLERVARDPLRRGARDDLDALRRVRPDPVLDPGVQVLGVLAHDDQVDVVVAGLDALHRPRRTDVGVQLERLAQPDVDGAEAGADRGRDRSLDGHAVASDRLDDPVRQRRPLAGDRRLAGLLDVPFEADAGRLEHVLGGLGQLRTDPVAGDQRDGVAHGIHLFVRPVKAPAYGDAV